MTTDQKPESLSPWGSKKSDWVVVVRVLKVGGVLIASTLITLIAYAARTYVKDLAGEKADGAVAPFLALPSKIQTLQEFQVRQEKETADEKEQIVSILVKISAIQTSQDETAKKTDRILRKLDNMPAHGP